MMNELFFSRVADTSKLLRQMTKWDFSVALFEMDTHTFNLQVDLSVYGDPSLAERDIMASALPKIDIRMISDPGFYLVDGMSMISMVSVLLGSKIYAVAVAGLPGLQRDSVAALLGCMLTTKYDPPQLKGLGYFLENEVELQEVSADNRAASGIPFREFEGSDGLSLSIWSGKAQIQDQSPTAFDLMLGTVPEDSQFGRFQWLRLVVPQAGYMPTLRTLGGYTSGLNEHQAPFVSSVFKTSRKVSHQPDIRFGTQFGFQLHQV